MILAYKISIWKPTAFLYTSNEHMEKLKIQCHLQSLKKTKYLGIKWTKRVQDSYVENDTVPMEKNQSSKWTETHHVHGLEDSTEQRCEFSPNWYTGSMQSVSKSQQDFQ